jgi:hypothetical protein
VLWFWLCGEVAGLAAVSYKSWRSLWLMSGAVCMYAGVLHEAVLLDCDCLAAWSLWLKCGRVVYGLSWLVAVTAAPKVAQQFAAQRAGPCHAAQAVLFCKQGLSVHLLTFNSLQGHVV